MLTAFTKQQGHSVNVCGESLVLLLKNQSLITGASYVRYAINRLFQR
jgi:hypothetical protein